MSFWDLLFIAIGLAMDALAVAIGKGLAANGECKKICIITGLYFGSFQTFMPFLGFLCGETISHYITSVTKISSLILLVLIGLNMFRGQIVYGNATQTGPLLAMAIATIIPVLCMYLFFQRYFVEGVTLSGVKG